MARPAFLPLPGFVVKMALGEMGEELLLKGARVHPGRLQSVGFPYLFGNLQAALTHELGV
jgi:NAD dependent epimerase/dehydratase family enzyme